jgi:hypothetical protein
MRKGGDLMLRCFLPMALFAFLFLPAFADDLTDEERRALDRLVAERGWNAYGDPVDTVYSAGPRLYDARTGDPIDRHHYILQNHPELRSEIRALVPRRETFISPPADRASPAPSGVW